MKTKLTRYHLILSFILGGLVSCDKSAGGNEVAQSSSSPTVTEQKAVPLPPDNQQTPMRTDEQPLPTIADLSSKVRMRTGIHDSDAVVAMHQLLQQWSPVGKQVADVKSMLGTPSEENAVQLVYGFDDGDQAYEWTLPMTNGVITSVNKMLYE